ncbi:MAG TPA: cupredoxin domain-containing protein [Anaeromyxobacter sp.]|nr:cupredoxin domain-containing protein [Anaeromyxobacter sp.]
MTRTFAAILAAAVALAAGGARAQHAGPDAAQHERSKQASSAALAKAGIAEGTLKDGVRTVEMAVTEDGFVPSKIKANKGEKLRLIVTRKTERTCATEIVVPGHGIDQKLPLNQPVTVELTPKASGEIRYACGMNHVSGVVFVP